MLKVTTSWDDGDILDKRLSGLLSRYNLKGTFYITKKYRPKRLSAEEIKNLSIQQEIGAHTLTHPDLRALSPEEKRVEIEGGKKWLEELLGSEVKMFCYPKGLYDDSTVSVVKEARFLGVRTTKLNEINMPSDTFHLNTTLQVYPFPFRKLGPKQYYLGKLFKPYQQRGPKLRELGVSIFSMHSWLSMAKATFDITLKSGEVFHLWGHSWEIEKYGMWDDLEKFLQYIANNKNCAYLTNSEILQS